MEILNTWIGEIQIDEENVVNFPSGLPGFSELHRFALLPDENGSLVNILQSLDDSDVSFIVANPQAFFPDYRVAINMGDLAELGLASVEEAQVFVILVVNTDPQKITANLMAPVIINWSKKLAKQIIIDGEHYTTKHRIFPE